MEIMTIIASIAVAFNLSVAAPLQTDPWPDHDVIYFEAADYWDGPILTAENGTVEGPSGTETYYNLPMDGVLEIMRGAGWDEESFPYWERDDGMKMLGPYIMVAADQSIRPLGTVVETTRGLGIVCDTGTFIYTNSRQLDLAVTW